METTKIYKEQIVSVGYSYEPSNFSYSIVISTKEKTIIISGLEREEKEKLMEGLSCLI